MNRQGTCCLPGIGMPSNVLHIVEKSRGAGMAFFEMTSA